MTALLTDTPAPGVRRLLINRPEARNAIDAEVRELLAAALEDAARDDDVRALLIGGAGGMFCAGGDLPSLVGLEPELAAARMAQGHAIVRRLWTFPKPVVSAIERFAIGAGAGLALLADRIVMDETARLVFPFLKLGLVPDWGLMATLPWRTGMAAAARLLGDAAELDGKAALAAGAVDEVAAADRLMALAIARAAALAELPLAAFARMKAGLRSIDLTPALDHELAAQVACLGGAEFAEGYAAFREKRAPSFSAPAAVGS
jgi:2-(1,2-epoxy-1,2-dihydrophenyl)acetyl-CoA isomerase